MFVKAEGYQSILKLSCGPLAFAPCRAFFGGGGGMSGATVLGGWFGAGGGSGGAGRGGGRLISTFPCSFAAAGRVWFVCVCVCVLRGGEGGWLCVHSDLRFS